MNIEWQISEIKGIDNGFLEELVVERHIQCLGFLSKEMGFDEKPNPVGRIIFAPETEATYYRAGEIKGLEEDTIKIGIIGQSSQHQEIIKEIKWDVVHETGHHLHYKKNPAIVGNNVWGRMSFITYPLDNWYLREIVAEYGALLFYSYNRENLPLGFFQHFKGRIEPILNLYSSNKNLLKELTECDELDIPEKFIEVIKKMDNAERIKVGLI